MGWRLAERGGGGVGREVRGGRGGGVAAEGDGGGVVRGGGDGAAPRVEGPAGMGWGPGASSTGEGGWLGGWQGEVEDGAVGPVKAEGLKAKRSTLMFNV